MRISWEDYKAWLNNPVTREITVARQGDIARLHEFMGNGGTINGDSIDSTAISTATNVGYIKGLREALAPPDYLQQPTQEE